MKIVNKNGDWDQSGKWVWKIKNSRWTGVYSEDEVFLCVVVFAKIRKIDSADRLASIRKVSLFLPWGLQIANPSEKHWLSETFPSLVA